MGDQFYPYKTVMDHDVTDSIVKHGCLVDWADEGSLESCGGGDRYPYLKMSSIPRHLARFLCRKGGGDRNNGDKLVQYLANVDRYPIFLVFFELRKLYDNLYGGLLQTLARYGAGPKLRVILAEFWSKQEIVTRQNGLHEPQF